MKNPPLSQLAEEIVLKTIKCEFESHKGDHPLYTPNKYIIYGPYQRKDKRRHVIAYDGKRKITISYSRFIMECFLGEILSSSIDVHHKNEIVSDDRLDNYEILDSSDHKSYHASATPEIFICPTCKNHFTLFGIKLSWHKSNLKKNPNKNGPYCSKRCAGIQNN